VYLHAGTRAGARALGLNWRATTLAVHDLPAELRVLAPHEIEDCLCIFKNNFEKPSSIVRRRQYGARRAVCRRFPWLTDNAPETLLAVDETDPRYHRTNTISKLTMMVGLCRGSTPTSQPASTPPIN
jgi:hypothetical protein